MGIATDWEHEGKSEDLEGASEEVVEAARAVEKRNVWSAKVPFTTAARLIRDMYVGGGTFVKQGTTMAVNNTGNTSAAPSKVLIKVKKIIVEAGFTQSGCVSFKDFSRLCCQVNKDWGRSAVKLFDALQKVNSSRALKPSWRPPKSQSLLGLLRDLVSSKEKYQDSKRKKKAKPCRVSPPPLLPLPPPPHPSAPPLLSSNMQRAIKWGQTFPAVAHACTRT